MTKRIASLTSMILLALGLVAFTGSALAGNGNGKNNDTAAAPPATANSANAQGQGNGKDKGTADQSVKGSATQNSGRRPV